MSEHLEGDILKWSISDLSPDKISNVEADCYWCLSKLLDGMQDHYTFAQPGIQRLVFKLKELVNRIDGKHFLYFLLPANVFLGRRPKCITFVIVCQTGLIVTARVVFMSIPIVPYLLNCLPYSAPKKIQHHSPG